LWNCFENIKENTYPTFGLNFIKNFKNKNNKFLLICGFETFGPYIVRIDMLERLFLKIIAISKNGSFELSSDMLNLLGCSKDDFNHLMIKMNYVTKNENDKNIYLYKPKKINLKKIKEKELSNPFIKLKDLKIIS
jgi:ATP-dependent RNA helicase SUPV3L1/SUV3